MKLLMWMRARVVAGAPILIVVGASWLLVTLALWLLQPQNEYSLAEVIVLEWRWLASKRVF